MAINRDKIMSLHGEQIMMLMNTPLMENTFTRIIEEARREPTPHVVRYFRNNGKNHYTPPSDFYWGRESDCVWIVPGTGQ